MLVVEVVAVVVAAAAAVIVVIAVVVVYSVARSGNYSCRNQYLITISIILSSTN